MESGRHPAPSGRVAVAALRMIASPPPWHIRGVHSLHARAILICTTLAFAAACGDDEVEPSADETDGGYEREGEPLWALVQVGSGLSAELWAFDISEPDTVLYQQRLISDDGELALSQQTPWGSWLVWDSQGTRQLRLDDDGDLEWANLAPEGAPTWVTSMDFDAAGERMLAALSHELGWPPEELWLVDFDAKGEVVDGQMIIDGSCFFNVGFTPDEDAAFWLHTADDLFVPTELMMTPLEPTPGASVGLTPGAISSYELFGDKVIARNYRFDSDEGETWLLSLDDLQAGAVAGPTVWDLLSASFDSEGHWMCMVENDEVHAIAFAGLEFSEPFVVSAPEELAMGSCVLQRADTLLYFVGDGTVTSAVHMVDVSGDVPGEPVVVAAGERIRDALLSFDRERLFYLVTEGSSERLEVVEFDAPGVGVELASFTAGSGFQRLDAQRLLVRGTAQGASDRGLWLVEFGPELDPESITVTELALDLPAGLSVSDRLVVTADQEQVVFFAETGEALQLWRTPLAGGSSSPIRDQPGWAGFAKLGLLAP
ncbi:hypothetical protein G6O69_15400 [Pseudenhygromyxa sp. WMMC2535]|uniref:hypothetical protein n=1 Tax=Pseudenhygromyxa sp. WMMC2535 TaxID=2712867 RepID=UPI001594FC8A|nr:hypothetical protein [Pseudenhygromyxa sp. WMMC2535]NVB39228.1 hypothetical protein [Pseudenhygromyxa sp. WMMC2535]